MALPRVNHLTKKKDFDVIFKEGNAVKGNFLFIKYKKNALPNSRFAFIVSVKVAKKAVTRNRIRRQLSELVRRNIDKIKDGYDVLVMIKKEEKDDILKSELLTLLTKVSLFK